MKEVSTIAHLNLNSKLSNLYPGRGLVVGLDESAQNIVQVYWTMGKDEASIKRVLNKNQSGDVIINPYGEKEEGKDYDLILYRAMAECRGIFVAANGHHLESIIRYIDNTERPLTFNLEDTLVDWGCELDIPVSTPRISLVSNIWNEYYGYHQLSIIKRGWDLTIFERSLYTYRDLIPGIGHCLTTYSGEKDKANRPVPYYGEPFIVPLEGGMKKVTETFWKALDEEMRVAVATKFIDVKTRESRIFVINRFKK